jgi:hypothetical protein
MSIQTSLSEIGIATTKMSSDRGPGYAFNPRSASANVALASAPGDLSFAPAGQKKLAPQYLSSRTQV